MEETEIIKESSKWHGGGKQGFKNNHPWGIRRILKIMQAVKLQDRPICTYYVWLPQNASILKKANYVKERDAAVKDCTLKAYLCFYLDAEDSFEDELDYSVLVKLALLKSMWYPFWSPYQTWNSNWEHMLYDGMYMTDDEFLSNFQMDRACKHQLQELVKDDQVFWQGLV